MEKFIGREQELKALNEMYHKNGFQMAVIYGRRRVGKSTLINEFIKDKKNVFWPAIKTNRERNLELDIHQSVLDKYNQEFKVFDYPDNKDSLRCYSSRLQFLYRMLCY